MDRIESDMTTTSFRSGSLKSAQAPAFRTVAVVGLGFVGLPAAMLACGAGYFVVGFDTDLLRIARLQGGESYVGDVSEDMLRRMVKTGRFRPMNDPNALAGFDIALIAVPTPMVNGQPDLSCIEAASRTLAEHLRPGCTVVLESTTYPGTTEEIVVPILETSGLKAGDDFRVGYAPERLNPGAGLESVRSVPKIVAGLDEHSRTVIADFWRDLVDEVVPAPDIRTAELAKLIENTFRLVGVSLVNEMAQHAHALDVSIWEALQLAASKPYGYMGFRPGVGAGGHCLPVDAAYLAWRVRQLSDRPAQLIETAVQVNDSMPGYIAHRIAAGVARSGRPAAGAQVVAVGATYKPGIADVRESAALKVIDELRQLGVEVVVVDPLVTDRPDVISRLTPEMVWSASAVAVLVPHDGLDHSLIRSARYVFDACAVLQPAANIEWL